MSKTNQAFKLYSDGVVPLEQIKIATKNDRRFSKIFYNIKNHDQIFHLGESFLKDFEQGDKMFAISSVIGHKSQRATILGLSCFFDHIKDLKIAIISNNLQLDVYKDVLNECSLESIKNEKLDSDDIKVYRFLSHFDFIPMENLQKMNQERAATHFYERMMKMLIESYDVVFWDLPTLDLLKKEPHNYFSLVTSTDSITLVVPHHEVNEKDANELKSYFENYGVKIKGLVLDQEEQTEHKSVSFLKKILSWSKSS